VHVYTSLSRRHDFRKKLIFKITDFAITQNPKYRNTEGSKISKKHLIAQRCVSAHLRDFWMPFEFLAMVAEKQPLKGKIKRLGGVFMA